MLYQNNKINKEEMKNDKTKCSNSIPFKYSSICTSSMATLPRVLRLSALVTGGGLAYFGTLALSGFRLADFKKRGA